MEPIKRFVTSNDGTTIGYRQVGEGPGLVVLHGSMSTGYNHIQLAEQLADRFTVYLPDRRGRGLSGPYRQGDTIESEVEDLIAVLTETGAQDLAGVSYGAIICLEAAVGRSSLGKIALYEPPLRMKNQKAVLERLESELASGNVPAALVTAMKGTQMGPQFFDVMPRWLLVLMTRQMIAAMDRKGTGEYESFRALAPTLQYEARAIMTASARIDRISAIRNEVLLVGGSKSAGHFKNALDLLADVLPRAERIELPGLGHPGAWNRDVGGKPEVVASAFEAFFRGVTAADRSGRAPVSLRG
ncbi:MAG TPA: alpha/beta hydrolase [Candidatus Dormibacteraeota bacterium]|nr:alpha/beta hydrolase [Candidatus Dormibacteraeota bacterium]